MDYYKRPSPSLERAYRTSGGRANNAQRAAFSFELVCNNESAISAKLYRNAVYVSGGKDRGRLISGVLPLRPAPTEAKAAHAVAKVGRGHGPLCTQLYVAAAATHVLGTRVCSKRKERRLLWQACNLARARTRRFTSRQEDCQ